MEFTIRRTSRIRKHKRNIITLVSGAAKKGHYLFQKPSIKSALDRIDPSLYRDYLGIMVIKWFHVFYYGTNDEMMSQTGSRCCSKSELEDADPEEQEEGIDTKIKATGFIFPILCHEIVKGLEEAKARHGLPEDPETRRKVYKNWYIGEWPMQLRIGTWNGLKIKKCFTDEVFDADN